MIHPEKINQARASVYPTETHWTPTPGNTDINAYLGKLLHINHHQVIVESVLGQGGYAFVFRVRTMYQQRYALKRMYVNNRRDLIVCQREIDLLKEFISHPNIVQYVDSSIRCVSSGSFANRQYYRNDDDNDTDDDSIHEILLLTEFCSNGALTTQINEQRRLGITLNEQQILHIFADLCRAVSACHSRRPQAVFHRDIKLENLIIDSRQNYVLCDFGSAILLSPSKTTGEFEQYSSEQMTTTVIQRLEEDIQRYTTLSYRAPEMVDLYSRTPITLKADIWAMGCLLYRLMYNVMPFGESVLAIQNGTFVIPDEMSNVYSRNLNKLLRYLLEIDPKKRPDIWQVSYVTFKLLGLECSIPNRCQAKTPDLNSISMPLTDSEYRHQRALAASKNKSTSSQVINESSSSSIGTAINPRERPRGLMAPSVSLMNFNSAASAPTSQSVSSTNPPRSDSAAQLMFDDDFSQLTSHTISLTNIPSTTTLTNDNNASHLRPPTATAVPSQQGFLQPPTVTKPLGHRRSVSQTVNPTYNQSSTVKTPATDLSNMFIKEETSRPSNTTVPQSSSTVGTSHASSHISFDPLSPHHQRRNPPSTSNHDPSSDLIQMNEDRQIPNLFLYQKTMNNYYVQNQRSSSAQYPSHGHRKAASMSTSDFNGYAAALSRTSSSSIPSNQGQHSNRNQLRQEAQHERSTKTPFNETTLNEYF